MQASHCSYIAVDSREKHEQSIQCCRYGNGVLVGRNRYQGEAT